MTTPRNCSVGALRAGGSHFRGWGRRRPATASLVPSSGEER